jgi:NAD(P)-dependent dehydrogenase (short-subunit alcohol dehydrogenase family)
VGALVAVGRRALHARAQVAHVDLAKAWDVDTVEHLNRTNPMRRIGQPDDLIGVCLFLASDASSYVNGAQILCDGGSFRTL